MLIRRFINVGFRLLEREDWDLRAIELYNEVLTSPGGPLQYVQSWHYEFKMSCSYFMFHSVESPKTPHSLTYHLAEIFLDELEKVSAASPSSFRSIPLVPLLQPYMRTLTIAPSSPIFSRLIEGLFKPMLTAFFPPPSKPQPRRRKKDGPPPPRPEYPAILDNCVEDEGAEAEKEGEFVGKEILKSMFEVGGRPDVDEHNRRKIYQFVAEWDVELD